MKRLVLATLLSAAAAAHAGESRILFVCEAGNAATCALAAQRFEALSREHGWAPLDAHAATVDALDVDQLALAAIVVSIDAALYRRWLLSIRRLESWTGLPPADADRAAASDEIDRRLQALMAP